VKEYFNDTTNTEEGTDAQKSRKNKTYSDMGV